MENIKKPTIWHYLFWGLIIGWIGSWLVVQLLFKFHIITKTPIFHGIFGPNFRYDAINKYGPCGNKYYYEYIIELVVLIIMGAVLGLTVGISNRSFKKTIYAVLGGIFAGSIIPYFYSNMQTEPFYSFRNNIPNLLFWHAATIILFLAVERTDFNNSFLKKN